MPRMPQVTARELVRFLKSQGFIALLRRAFSGEA